MPRSSSPLSSLLLHATSLLGALGALGCGPDLPSYSALAAPRLLALRAAPPSLAPGESTTLDALLYAGSDDAEIAWSWSWCPLLGPSTAGFPCALTEEALRARLGSAAEALPPYDLGSAPTASFSSTLLASTLEPLCEELALATAPGLAPPDCRIGLTVYVRLRVTVDGVPYEGLKEVLLQTTPAAPNRNPTLGALRAALAEKSEEGQLLAAEAPTALRPHTRYRLRVELPEDAAEPDAAGQREVLAVTWLAEGGEWEATRTGFIDGETTLEEASLNLWTSPAARSAPLRLVVVVRDDRGGVDFLTRAVTLNAL